MADNLPFLKCRTSRKSGALTYPEPLGHLGLLRDDLYLYLSIILLMLNIHFNLNTTRSESILGIFTVMMHLMSGALSGEVTSHFKYGIC
jgi:hypothetical protein